MGECIDGDGDRKQQHEVGRVAHFDAVGVANSEPLLGDVGDRVAVAFDLVLVIDDVAVRLQVLAGHTTPMGYSADEGLEIGRDLGSPSSHDYGPRGYEFNGTIACVQLDVGTDDHDHLISPEERFNFAMAKQ